MTEGRNFPERAPEGGAKEIHETILNDTFRYLTIRELVFLRLIPQNHPLTETDSEEFDKPLDIVSGRVSDDEGNLLSLEAKREERFKVGDLEGGAIIGPEIAILGRGKQIVVSLSRLDSEGKRAKPKIIALWDRRKRQLIKPSPKELEALNKKYLDRFAKSGLFRVGEPSLYAKMGKTREK